MLLQERVHQVQQLSGAFELRKDVVLLVLLVILLHEVADEAGGVLEHLGRDLLPGTDAADAFLVDEQAAVQNAMLLHQVFRRRHPLVRVPRRVHAAALRRGQ